MSYDLMIFNPSSAPKTRVEFMEWYFNQTEWTEEHSYDDPKVASLNMQEWFKEMIKTYPALNGPFADEDTDFESDMVTDYCVGRDVIYVAFRWTVAEEAYNLMRSLAEKYGVGFFDASANDGSIFFPAEDGGYVKIDNLNKETSIEEIKNSSGNPD